MGDREYNLKYAQYWVEVCKRAYKDLEGSYQTKVVNFMLRKRMREACDALANKLVSCGAGETQEDFKNRVLVKSREICASHLGNYEANNVFAFCGLEELPYKR